MLALSAAVQQSMAIGPPSADTSALRPLASMSGAESYHGEDGGLYGGGHNVPPRDHLVAAIRAGRCVRPLNARGVDDWRGLIGFLAVGFSNTFHEFRDFASLARLSDVSPRVRLVNGAQLHASSGAWASPKCGEHHGDPWTALNERLEQTQVAANQIQVAWIKVTQSEPAAIGAFPLHARQLTSDLRIIAQQLSRKFPNLRLAFVSSRIFGGYACTPLNPEPYAYESAFSVRWLIQQQIRGDTSLNWNPANGRVCAPLLLWGPYLWAPGTRSVANEDLVWTRDDFRDDGTHPSAAGIRKVAQLLLMFMQTHPASRPWFLRRS